MTETHPSLPGMMEQAAATFNASHHDASMPAICDWIVRMAETLHAEARTPPEHAVAELALRDGAATLFGGLVGIASLRHEDDLP